MRRSDDKRRWARCAGALICLALAPACPAEPGTGSEPVAVDLERFLVELRDDDYALGGEKPLVTIVLFSDYACAPCGRTWRLMRDLVEDYGEDLRVVYRSYTVAGHVHGDRAAEAAFAAGAQGKFWDMHWRLFEDEDQFSRPSLRAHAEAIGLDLPRFLDDLDGGAFAGRRMRDRRQATELRIMALPVAFINGLSLLGARPDEPAWRGLIDEEIKRSRRMMQDGVARADLYAAYMQGARKAPVVETEEARDLRAERAAERAAEAAKQAAASAAPDPALRYAVPLDGAPATGPADAPVVVVEFVDFQCPYCKNVARDVLPALRGAYPKQLRIVARHLPLEIHPAAPGAARAAVAADRQGRFWEFHDALFRSEGELARARFVEIARELGLDIARFERDLEDPASARTVAQDLALARRLGVQGTPSFFVNGRYLHGFQDLGTLRGRVDEELARARELVAGGTSRREVHAALMKDAVQPIEFPNHESPSPEGGG